MISLLAWPHARDYGSPFVGELVNWYLENFPNQNVRGIMRALTLWRMNVGLIPLQPGYQRIAIVGGLRLIKVSTIPTKRKFEVDPESGADSELSIKSEHNSGIDKLTGIVNLPDFQTSHIEKAGKDNEKKEGIPTIHAGPTAKKDAPVEQAAHDTKMSNNAPVDMAERNESAKKETLWQLRQIVSDIETPDWEILTSYTPAQLHAFMYRLIAVKKANGKRQGKAITRPNILNSTSALKGIKVEFRSINWHA